MSAERELNMLLLILLAFAVIESVVIVLLLVDYRTRRSRELIAKVQRLADGELTQTLSQMEQLVGKLIRAQDEERKLISRDLHDDIGQRLSLLAIELDLLSRRLVSVGYDGEVDQVSTLKQQADELTSDVHQLSDQLYSAKLQHLGLHSAVEELTKQVCKHNQISIKFNDTQSTHLPADVALCFFRVTQEALNNVLRHSKAESVSIDFVVQDGMAHLRIADNGQGFDVSVCKSGLGMLGMRERLRMLGGNIVVDSSPGEGTLITAAVPLKHNRNEIKSRSSGTAA